MHLTRWGYLHQEPYPGRANSSGPLDLVNLSGLMELSSGTPGVRIGIIDGPVATDHPDLEKENIHEIPGKLSGTCALASTAACMHGTFVAGVLFAKRGSRAPAICPNCTLLIRPIFAENTSGNGKMPSANSEELSEAIIDCVDAGARLINLSAALIVPSAKGSNEELGLKGALGYAAKRGAITVAATGNQGSIGSSLITSHPWVIPVAACDTQGRLITYSNIGISIGRRGLTAPGENITSLGAEGKLTELTGTSAAAPFVTGAIALLWSLFPNASPLELKIAFTGSHIRRRPTIVPKLMDAWAAYEQMKNNSGRLVT